MSRLPLPLPHVMFPDLAGGSFDAANRRSDIAWVPQHIPFAATPGNAKLPPQASVRHGLDCMGEWHVDNIDLPQLRSIRHHTRRFTFAPLR